MSDLPKKGDPSQEAAASENPGANKSRKPYRSPRLETFGSVGKLTGTSPGKGSDLGTSATMNKGSCL